jgi:hypothetical protein
LKEVRAVTVKIVRSEGDMAAAVVKRNELTKRKRNAERVVKFMMNTL